MFTHRYGLLLQVAVAACTATAIVIGFTLVGVGSGFGTRLIGGHLVEQFLLGLAGLGLSLASTHVGEGGLVYERLELGAGTPASVYVRDEGGAEGLCIVGGIGFQGHVEGAKVAKIHSIAKQKLFADAINQLSCN